MAEQNKAPILKSKMYKMGNMYGSRALALTTSHYIICNPLMMPPPLADQPPTHRMLWYLSTKSSIIKLQ